jgi:glycogen operon protein
MIHAIHKKGMKIIMEMSFSEGESEDMMLDCLKFWVNNYHIDGFHIVGLAAPIERIVNDPYLSDVYFFYDNFPENLLREDKSLSRRLFVDDTRFMYPLRKLINHKDGSIVEFTNMMRRQNERYGFVNFCASSNSGYTLLDSFSYKEKHNEANGEENRDGNNFNFSDNYGNEGETNSRLVWNVRLKNCRTSMAAAILAQSIPMIQSGDEVLNSQKGNNNPYCQDNEIGWVNFNNKKRTREFKAYVKKLFEFRQKHPVLWTLKPKEMSDPMHKGLPDLSYHGREPWTVWLSEDRKAVGILYSGLYGNHSKEDDVMLLFNFYLEEERFALPSLINQRKWYFAANTSDEVWPDVEQRLEADDFITVPGSSLTILVGKTEK